MKILLGGVPLGCDNIGDEAIIACVVKLLRGLFPAAELTVSTREPEKTAKLLGISDRALGEEEKKVFVSWRTELGYSDDMILAAYESMIKSIGSYKYQYIDKILRSWKAEGITDPSQASAKKPSPARKGKTKGYSQTPDTEKTVDKTWEIMKKAVNGEDEQA